MRVDLLAPGTLRGSRCSGTVAVYVEKTKRPQLTLIAADGILRPSEIASLSLYAWPVVAFGPGHLRKNHYKRRASHEIFRFVITWNRSATGLVGWDWIVVDGSMGVAADTATSGTFSAVLHFER